MSTPLPGLSAGFFSVGPRTPEPTSFTATDAEVRPPSPPRPRLRLKRRPVPQLLAPTQNFLASVAAAEGSLADVPIPSIEEPDAPGFVPGQLFGLSQSRLLEQQARLSPEDDGAFLSVRGRSRFSPPKTPAPGPLPSLSPSRYPNWSIDSALSSSAESSPERDCGSSRPSTARSTQTSSSSLYSRFSQLSDDDNCILSPEEESFARYRSGSVRPGNELRKDALLSRTAAVDRQNAAVSRRRTPTLRKAPWTRAMSSHLWATYMLYLQDPKVTPFRVGKSCVPPHGVCMRVAREAKRSWKGARARVADKSGSSTPTAGGSAAACGAFMEWPHTNAATRAHLRELCRLKASTPGGGARDLQYMSRSPTPFLQTAAATTAATATTTTTRNLRPGPGQPPMLSSFATRDMAVSLAVSTCEVMQPQAPMARLTRSTRSFSDAAVSGAVHSLAGRLSSVMAAEEPSGADRRRLGSPFGARSYGPSSSSSSSSLAAVLGLSMSAPRPHAHTVGSRRSLQSPVRLNRTSASNSISISISAGSSTGNSTSSSAHKRRSHQLARESRKRPSLDSDFFTEPFDYCSALEDATTTTTTVSDSEMDCSSTGSSTRPKGMMFVPRTMATSSASLTTSTSAPQLTTSTSSSRPVPQFLRDLADEAPLHPPARLGSPFSVGGSASTNGHASFSFPNRLSQPADYETAPTSRPFATAQRLGQAKAVPARANLASRMAYLDQRLRELNNRRESRRESRQERRSESPL